MNRILVTGATGFVGRCALPALAERGFEIHAMMRHTGGDLPAGVTCHAVDMLDIPAATRLIGEVRPTHLLLSAWTTQPGAFWTDPQNESWAAATQTMARAFFAAGGRRAMLAGSCAEYDWSDPVLASGPVREDAAQGLPQTPYGRAKRRAAEALAKAAADAGGEHTIGRIFFPMGPGEHRNRFLPDIATALIAGHPAKLGPGQQVRDIIDVRDAGAALAALVDANVVGAVNVGSGVGVRLADVALRVGEMVGRPDLVHLGSLPARPGEPPVLVADVSRLRGGTGFQPRFKLEDTLAATLSYWRAVEHT